MVDLCSIVKVNADEGSQYPPVAFVVAVATPGAKLSMHGIGA